jgi:WD40 repeat protein
MTHPHLELITHLRFNETPECACFAPTDLILPHLIESARATSTSTSSSSFDIYQSDLPFLIVGLRDVPYLLYLSLQTLQTFRISLNEHDWDTHVSFTPLALSLSHHQKYLAVATDKDLHIVYHLGTNTRVRVLGGGHQCDSYGKPKIVWDLTDLYLYCTSQGDYLLHLYSLTNSKEVTKERQSLNVHKGQIRDLCYHPTERRLLTTSFDRTVVEWYP